MNLHNSDKFKMLLLTVSKSMGVSPAILEKDYYVTLFLKELFALDPDYVFKGGTSLSKCFKVVDRFSEDIDITHLQEGLTRSKRKNIKYQIVDTVEKHGLQISNLDKTRSGRNYNKYIVPYDKIFVNPALKQDVVIEVVLDSPAYPVEKKMAQSIIGEWLEANGYHDIVAEFELEAFEVTVISLVRTFIDKCFALANYYLDNRVQEHARHIYDLYKIYPLIKFDAEFKEVFNSVKGNNTCNRVFPSEKYQMPLYEVLEDIFENDIYKVDYETVTMAISYEVVPYEEAITVLPKIIEELKKIEGNKPNSYTTSFFDAA